MAFRTIENIWGNLRQLADRDVWEIADPGDPTNGTSGTGAGFAGIGSMYTNTTTGNKFVNTNTKASPTWTVVGGIVAGSVTLADLATGISPSHVAKFGGTNTSGATTAVTIAAVGALTTDVPLVTWRVAPQTIAHIIAVPTTDAINVTFSATVGTAGTLNFIVMRAAS